MPTLEFVKYEFLTHTVNFCTRSAFSQVLGLGPGLLYTVCRVLENFIKTICLNQEYKCKVKLPFKETRDILHDPFALCEKHLLKLNTYLKNDTVLLKKYNDIFSDKTELAIIEKTKQTVERSNSLANTEEILHDTICVTYKLKKGIIETFEEYIYYLKI